jgi:hypothetical protein
MEYLIFSAPSVPTVPLGQADVKLLIFTGRGS